MGGYSIILVVLGNVFKIFWFEVYFIFYLIFFVFNVRGFIKYKYISNKGFNLIREWGNIFFFVLGVIFLCYCLIL